MSVEAKQRRCYRNTRTGEVWLLELDESLHRYYLSEPSIYVERDRMEETTEQPTMIPDYLRPRE